MRAKKQYNLIFLTLCFLFSSPLLSFEQVVIWGHKLHSHTHSYIHEGFYRGFQYLGYPTFWFDDADDVTHFDFSNSLFITEGQVDKKIPLRSDCEYILHNCHDDKYQKQLDQHQWISMKTYRDGRITPELEMIAPFIYQDKKNKIVYMPWATDLLPYEIEDIQVNLSNIWEKRSNNKKIVYWIGTIGGALYGNINELNPFKRACKENGVKFSHNDPWVNGLDRSECVPLISNAYLAPAIVGTWQEENGYIPCRIFKNISYGQMGVTNSRHVYELFHHNVVYNKDTYQLFFDASERLKTWTLEDQYRLMDEVKNNHTYLNRIQLLLDFFESIKQQETQNQ